MNILARRWLLAFWTCGLLATLAGCTVTGDGVYGGVGVGYDGGYYEPYGYDYGGWGTGYVVGPGRGNYGGTRGRPGGSHPYHPAAGGHPTPSIPQRSRGR